MRRVSVCALLVALLAGPVFAQSQATTGSIEGTVMDSSGGVLPGVVVTVTNTDTGAERSTVTNVEGLFRALLLPLGRFRIVAELQGFKRFEQTGVTLSAGETAVINPVLSIGSVQETVQVVAETPVTEPARIELGRTITAAEFKNLPLVSRNSFNFGLLQPNVTGYEDVEFGATRVNANGSQMRTNYQIDGSSATQKNRAGLRMFQPSEIMVQEVKVTSSGFAPEFGQTTGMVYNVITPSGTNQYRGDASFRFRRKDFSARPFTLAANAPKPDTHVNDVAGTFGGPVVRDRFHFYAGYEYVKKDLSADRVITVNQATATELGLSPGALGDGVIPAIQTVNMFVGKADYQVTPGNRLSGRWSVFNNKTPENIGSTTNLIPNTREVSYDFRDRMDNVGLQLTTAMGAGRLNEFRFAYGRRDNPLVASAAAGPGPSISVTGVANFGGVRYAPNTPVFLESYYQIVDNYNFIKGAHNIKVGFDTQWVRDERGADTFALYTFPDVASYVAARNGTNLLGYTQFQQNVGDGSLTYDQTYLSLFAQDDWRLSPQLKVLYGVRYDRFTQPAGDPAAPLPASQSFRTDNNNIAPRAGAVWAMDSAAKTVVRGSVGLMYEPPLGAFYEDALLQNGNPRLLSFSAAPSQAAAPAFPNTFSTIPIGAAPSNSLRVVSPDFETQYAWLTDVQIERALGADMSVSAAYVNATGRNLPLVMSANALPTGATLPDGRPVYSSTISAATRLDPRFNVIREVRSTGHSAYNAMTLSFVKRLSGGLLLNAFYTLAKAQDNGVIGGDYVVGSTDRSGISDPSDPERDYAYTSWNQTHTFMLTAVYTPSFDGDGIGAAVANGNQLGVVVQANSGLPYSIPANGDLNLDGIIDADRPNNIERNSRSLGTFSTVDLRYSRFVGIAGRRAEAFGEFKNLFNRRSIRAVNSVVATDTAGNPLAPVPDEFMVTQTYEPRQFQLGFRLRF
jgi:carboxypeptidase family protein/TonB-dependent receptor-like protein